VPRNLDAVLSWEEERVVQGDWTVACAGQRYQLDAQHEALSLVRRKVIVRTLRNGRVQVVYRGQPLKWRGLPEGVQRKGPPAKTARKVKTQTAVKSPGQNHPWRRLGVGAGRKFWNGIKAAGRATRRAVRDCRVGTVVCTTAPLSEPDWRVTHPALWMLSRKQTAQAAAPRPVGLGWGGCADTIRWSTKPDVP